MKRRHSLNWCDFEGWRAQITKCVSPYIDSAVLRCLKKNPPRHFVSDNLAWLEAAVLKVKGVSIELKAELAEKLPWEFDFIRGFHGCRPVSIDSYLEHGILPATAEWFRKEAIDCFGDTPRVREVMATLNGEAHGGS